MSKRLPLGSREEYLAAHRDWEEYFRSVSDDPSLAPLWEDWCATNYDHCQPQDDSCTILSKKRSDAPVGFSVHLCAPSTGAEPVFSYWRVMGEDLLDPPIKHFVVTTECDDVSVSEARTILRHWILEQSR
jgi:hypothetical protein